MKPKKLFWYTKPPISSLYGTDSDWAQCLVSKIVNMIFEARERNSYGNELLDYSFNHKDASDFKKIITCHTSMIKILSQIDVYSESDMMLSCYDTFVKFIFDDNCEGNVLKYEDGLYKNEIIIIHGNHPTVK